MPFTVEQFLDVFRDYNHAVFPAQFVLFGAAIAATAVAASGNVNSGRAIALILSGLWAWTGLAYHYLYFSRINTAAYAFGTLCIGQALIFLYHGTIGKTLRFVPLVDLNGIAGAVLIVFALVVYPALGFFLGHRYPFAPTFGAPCPTTIFTLGMLLWIRDRSPYVLIVIPFLWSLIGLSAAVGLAMWEDTGLLIAGLATVALILMRERQIRSAPG